MATGTTQFSDLSTNDVVNFIRDGLLDIAEKDVVFMEHASKVDLPQHSSKTVQIVRYKRLPLPQSPATEGVTPSSTKLENESLTAIVDQWIMVVTLTDIAELTIKHPLVPIVQSRLGTALAELGDREVQKVLLAGTGIQFAESKTSRGNLAATSVVNSTELRKLWKTLRRNGSRALGPNYLLIVDPEVSQDISSEQAFRDAHQFRDTEVIFNNEIGRYVGFRVMVSNLIPILDPIADANWSTAQSAGGTFPLNDVVRVKVTAVEDVLGFEEDISQEKSVTISVVNNKVTVTVPATTGFTYNLYVNQANGGTGDSTLHLHTSGIAPGGVQDVTAYKTTGANPPASPPVGISVHTSYAFGRDAYAAVRLSGDNLRVMMTKREPTDSDPAAQRRKLSFKGSFKAVILDNSWLRRLESASNF